MHKNLMITKLILIFFNLLQLQVHTASLINDEYTSNSFDTTID